MTLLNIFKLIRILFFIPGRKKRKKNERPKVSDYNGHYLSPEPKEIIIFYHKFQKLRYFHNHQTSRQKRRDPNSPITTKTMPPPDTSQQKSLKLTNKLGSSYLPRPSWLIISFSFCPELSRPIIPY